VGFNSTGKISIEILARKYSMEDKYPRVARAKQAQKFTDTLIERLRQILQPVGKCDEGSLVF